MPKQKSKSGEERRKNDAYYTPHQSIPAMLQMIDLENKRYILDVGAGEGRWGQAIRKVNSHALIAGVEIEDKPHPEEYDAWMCRANIFDFEIPDYFDLVIGNPPYHKVADIVEHCMKSLKDGGHLSFLLRLEFLASIGRKNGLFARHPIKHVLVSSRRIPFVSINGKTCGTIDFAQFIWQKGYDGQTTIGYVDWKEYNENS